MNSQQIDDYKKDGLTVFSVNSITEHISFLREQLSSLYKKEKKIRPWQLWELHNPWSRAALNVDSWKFLDLCQSFELLDQIALLIGEDIVLYDSQFSPDLYDLSSSSDAWKKDALRCPVEPVFGLVIRIIFSDSLTEGASFVYQSETGKNPGKNIQLHAGDIICHDINLHYRFKGIENLAQPIEYVIRYIPATSRYLRDPTKKVHRDLTEQYPLLNYAQMPLWLVRGNDRADNDFVMGFQTKAGRWIDI